MSQPLLRSLVAVAMLYVVGAFPGAAQAPRKITGQDLLRMIDQGRYAAAEPLLRRQLERRPSAKARYLLGFVLHHQFRFAEAQPLLEAAAQDEPERPPWLHTLAANLLELGRCGSAIEALDRAITLDPKPAFRYDKAMCALNQGDLASAERELRAVIAKAPEHALAHAELGLLLADQGDDEATRDALARALALREDLLEARFALGLAELRLGRLAAAEKAFREVRAVVPGHVGAAYNLGRMLARVGKREEGQQVLEDFRRLSDLEDGIQNHLQFIQSDPESLPSRLSLVELLLEAGRLGEAHEQVLAARALAPRRSDTYRLLARVARLQGREAEALRAERAAETLEGHAP